MSEQIKSWDMDPKAVDWSLRESMPSMPSLPSKQEAKAFAVTTVALLAIAAIAAFVTLALLQHYNVIHIGGKFGAALAESGKGIMVALNAIKHGVTTAAKTIAHSVLHNKATQFSLVGVGSALLGGGLGVAGVRHSIQKQNNALKNAE